MPMAWRGWLGTQGIPGAAARHLRAGDSLKGAPRKIKWETEGQLIYGESEK